SWMTPLNGPTLPVRVSVFEPSDTTPMPLGSNRPATLAPLLVCEISKLPLPGMRELKPTKAELAIEPLPLSASVAPGSICVALVCMAAAEARGPARPRDPTGPADRPGNLRRAGRHHQVGVAEPDNAAAGQRADHLERKCRTGNIEGAVGSDDARQGNPAETGQ